jgi:hypothetical protein
MRVVTIAFALMTACGTASVAPDLSGPFYAECGVKGSAPCCDTIQPGRSAPTGSCSTGETCNFPIEGGGYCFCDDKMSWACRPRGDMSAVSATDMMQTD